MMKSPQQELFDELFKFCLANDFKTYDFKPDAKADYPFVEFSETGQLRTPVKSGRLGKIPITINVWGSALDRGEVSEIAETIYNVKTINTTSSNFSLNEGASNLTMMKDTSTNTTLYRAMLELEYTYS